MRAWRRALIKESDRLLGELEEMALADVPSVPDTLQAAIARLAAAIEARYGARAGRRPTSRSDAYEFLLALQAPLLLGDPQRRPEGTRSGQRTAAGRVELPRRWRRGQTHSEWESLVIATVQRAHDRARLLEAQAARASLQLDRAAAAPAVAAAAVAHAEFADVHTRAGAALGHPLRLRSDALPELPRWGLLRVADATIDASSRLVVRNGCDVGRLEPQQLRLVSLLAASRGRPVSREAFLMALHGDDPSGDFRSRVVDVQVAAIRRLIGPLPIRAVPGIGYRWCADMPASKGLPTSRARTSDEARVPATASRAPAPDAAPATRRIA